MSKATITVEGYLAADPRTGETQNGKSYATISVPHTPRKREGNEWVDSGPTTWFEATFWNEDAHAKAAALSKGSYVVITGIPEMNVYKRQDGEPSATVRIQFATLGIIPKADRRGGFYGGGQPADEPWGQGGASSTATEPWSTGATYNDEKPF